MGTSCMLKCKSKLLMALCSFTLVGSRAMGAIHVCVFVRHDILDAVSNVVTSFVPCGIGNVMYNKVVAP